jgi:hypothetical protein
VLISNEASNDGMVKHYNHFNLINTGDDIYLYFAGVAVRKSLDQKLRSKLEEM